MPAELSQQQLEEMVNGKAQKGTVVFYDKARIDTRKSKEEGRRVYKTFTYVKVQQAGVTDWVAHIAKKHHIEQYPYEYQDYMNSKTGDVSPTIDIIPKITPAEKQELIDYGLRTIQKLSEATQVPEHLRHVHKSAIVLQSVLQEQSNVHEEKSIEEEARPVIESGAIQSQESTTIETEDVPQAGGLNDTGDVGRCEIPASAETLRRKAAERVHTGGRIDSGGQKLDYNWEISFS